MICVYIGMNDLYERDCRRRQVGPNQYQCRDDGMGLRMCTCVRMCMCIYLCFVYVCVCLYIYIYIHT
jgi:hypothetical protein